jgi:hypothetical protein
MISTRKFLLTFGILSWIGGAVWLAWWARNPASKSVTTGAIPALPWLPCIGGAILIVGAVILLSKKRLAILVIASLMVASILATLWVGSTRAFFHAGYNGATSVVAIAGESYDTQSSVTINVELGGIGVAYQSLWLSHDPARRVISRPEFGIGKYRTGSPMSYPGWGGGSFPVPKPIPRWGGFDSAWLSRSGPPVAHAVNHRAMYALVVPIWFPILFCVIAPALYLRKALKERRRIREDRCFCGYQLVGTPPNPDGTRRCSECGRVNPPPKAGTPGAHPN